jgi:amino acid transporter
MKNFIRNNGLSIVFFLLFVLSIIGQICFGFAEYNKERIENGVAAIGLFSYFSSGHFIQSTFENWESEFLQMALFVVFTIFLQQKGSSESKDFDKEEETDREPDPSKKDAPWPVKKGGLILSFYKYSLTIVLIILFLFSFGIHFYGSLKDENEQLAIKGLPLENTDKYLTDSRFWFESFQNWQSEFLSVLAIVLLSIWLRQKGSPQSKPVDAPFDETGS